MRAWRAEGAVGWRSFLSEGAWGGLDAAPQHRDGSGPAGPSSGARDVVLSRAVKAGGGEVDAGEGEVGGDRGLVCKVISPAEGLSARCDAAGMGHASRELGPGLACWKS